jgi:S-adenosylhomocysteine hydrolase
VKDDLIGYQNYLRKLPLLDFTRSLYPNICLEGIFVICAQHLVSTTYSLFHTLLKLGLPPDSLSAIGKCYSTDPKAYEEINKMGIDACPQSVAFNSHCAFDEQYREYIKKFVSQRKEKIKCKNFKKIIVLDDGGELLSAVSVLLDKDDERLIGIEQTSSGFHKLKRKKIKFPIINVARSPSKLNYESPIIARLVVDTLVRRIKSLPFKPTKVLIIGNGPIGSQIFEVLKSDYNVSTFDKAASRSSIKRDHFEHALKEFDLIIGCTGQPVLEPAHYKLLKENVILVSASSSDREFSAVNFRSKMSLIADCHANPLIDGVHLINCGFPINFASEYREIDIDELQLTRSLLLVAILQAASYGSTIKNGFVPLDMENQRQIVQKYLSLFSKDFTISREKITI